MEMSVVALEKAIELAGSQAELARRVGKKQAHVWNWLHRDRRVPADMAIPVEHAVGGKVSRYQLRSDLYQEPSNENQSRRDADRRSGGAA